MNEQFLMDTLQPYIGKRILIVGGTGYLGSLLVTQLSEISCEIDVIGRQIPKRLTNVSPAKIIFHKKDVSDPHTWKKMPLQFDYIFYLAAQTSVSVADRFPQRDWNINVLPFRRLLSKISKVSPDAMIVFAGTVTECGLPRYLPVDENHPDNPITIYDSHKLSAEKYLKSYCDEGLINGCTLRLANIYGPGGSSSSPDRGVLHLMINRAICGNNLTLFGDGRNIRDYIFVGDVMRAFLCAAPLGKQINGKKFVISSGVGTTIREAFQVIVDTVFRLYGTSVEIEIAEEFSGPQSGIDRRNFIGNPMAFTEETNWRPLIEFRQGVEDTIRYFSSFSKKH